MSSVNYYQVLGLGRDASPAQIKDAYRKLAKQLHPDKNSGAEAKEQFQLVNEAHAVLSDSAKRQQYDASLDTGDSNVTFDEMLQGLFSGLGRSEDFLRSRRRSASDSKTISVSFTLEELQAQHTKKVSFTRRIVCDVCRGLGASSPSNIQSCPTCQGRGQKMRIKRVGSGFFQQFVVTCDGCDGCGVRIKSACSACLGQRVIEETSFVYVPLDGSIEDGTKLMFRDAGDHFPESPRGHVIVVLKEVPHSIYSRSTENPADLKTKVRVSLLEAITGYVVDLPKLDGGRLRERIITTIKPGEIRRFRGAGLPTRTQTGDVYVQFEIAFPDRVDSSRHAVLADLLTNPHQPISPHRPQDQVLNHREQGSLFQFFWNLIINNWLRLTSRSNL